MRDTANPVSALNIKPLEWHERMVRLLKGHDDAERVLQSASRGALKAPLRSAFQKMAAFDLHF
jgi:hypothetical protein